MIQNPKQSASFPIASKKMEFVPKVSVAMITYNHEKYITQAVESVMMQRTDFDYEVIIGEDCSTDNTRKVLQDLLKKFSGKIRLLLHDHNLGANENFKQTLLSCKGQYLAILEGDDYWTSPNKLQIQVDALEKNPDWSICTHRITVFYEDGSNPQYLAPIFDPKPISTLEDLAKGTFVGTSAAVYRRIKNNDYPEWIFEITISDYALPLFYSKFGNIGFIDQVMCAYRKNKSSIWYTLPAQEQRFTLANDLKTIAKHQKGKVRLFINNQASMALLKVVKYYISTNEFANARKLIKEIMYMPRSIPYLPRKRLLKLSLCAYFPKLFQW